MDRKQIELKEVSGSGEVAALIATYGVVDKDGDVTERGFFGTQDVKIVSSHSWSDVLLGKGVLSDSDDGAVLEGKLNLDDPDGRNLHSKLMFDMENPPPLIEWSYGFKVLEGGSREPGKSGDPSGARRILQARPSGEPGAKVYEASPVLVGAGEGTGTLAVKSGETVSILEALAEKGDADAAELLRLHAALDAESEGKRFVEHVDRVAVAIQKMLDRADEIAALRKDGRVGAESLDRLTDVLDQIKQADERLSALLVSGATDEAAAVLREYRRYVSNTSNL